MSDALLNTALDFGRVGRMGYSEATIEQLQRQRCDGGAFPCRGALTCRSFAAINTWALLADSKLYVNRSDRESIRQFRWIRHLSLTVGGLLMAAGVSSTGDIFSLFNQHNVTTS